MPLPNPLPPKQVTLKGIVVGNWAGKALSAMDNATKGTTKLDITPATKITMNGKPIEQRALPKYARVTATCMDNDLKAKEVKVDGK